MELDKAARNPEAVRDLNENLLNFGSPLYFGKLVDCNQNYFSRERASNRLALHFVPY